MKDRIPGSPGRYSAIISAEDLQKLQSGERFAITLNRDDDPAVEGTPYSKAAVLPDAVATAICPDVEDPTPADAFSALKTAINGKAPAGYGLGTSKWLDSKTDENGNEVGGWNLALKSGFYSSNTNGPQTRDPHYMGIVVNFSEGSGIQVVWAAYPDANQNTAFMRVFVNNEFRRWEEWSPSKFAPSGYGLGESGGRVFTDFNSATRTGFYGAHADGAANGPSEFSNFKYGTLLVEARGTGRIHQKAIYGTHIAMRYTLDGGAVWTEWEYVNPPMNSSVEYRTTERFMGKAVYTKLIDCGTLANKGIDLVGYDENGEAVDFPSVIRYSGVMVNDGLAIHALPHIPNAHGIEDVWLSTDNTAFILNLHCGESMEGSAFTVKAQIWYIK